MGNDAYLLTGSVLRGTAAEPGAISGGLHLRRLPSATKERLICEEALFALLGMFTTFFEHALDAYCNEVYRSGAGRTVDAGAQIAPLAARILSLANYYASHYTVVSESVEGAFVARDAGGYVKQAIRVALAEKQALRNGSLSLQRVMYLMQPTLRSMPLLRVVMDCSKGLLGGAAVDAVYKLPSSCVRAEKIAQRSCLRD